MALYISRFRQYMKPTRVYNSIVTFSCLLANLFLARFVCCPVVLCFHQVKEFSDGLADKRIGVMSIRKFKNLIYYMRLIGYKFTSLDSLTESLSQSNLRQQAVITFDDGYKNLYSNAYPFLKKQKIPFTLFLITSTVTSKKLLWFHKLYVAVDKLSIEEQSNVLKKYINLTEDRNQLHKIIGNLVLNNNKLFIENLASNIAIEAKLTEEDERKIANKYYLSKDELDEMIKFGMNIEPHGHEHLVLSQLSLDETKREIKDSISYIEKEFTRKPSCYCLAHGISNDFVKDITDEFGINQIATTQVRLIDNYQDIYDLPRICLTNSDISQFYRILTRCYLKTLYKKIRSISISNN